MQSFDTNITNSDQLMKPAKAIDAGQVEDLPHGSSKTVELPEGRELALTMSTANSMPPRISVRTKAHPWQTEFFANI